MSDFVCPVCGKDLIPENKSLYCENRHCFDIAKGGYVNLLLGSTAKNHGDNRQMINARHAFLNKGYYSPLLEALCDTLSDISKNGDTLLDAGCGECYYTSGINNHLTGAGIDIHTVGIDVSKDALKCGSKRCRSISLAAASVYAMPFKKGFCDILLSIFAPMALEEFLRVLKPNGFLVMVIPSKKHLFSLKGLLYDKPYLNEVGSYDLGGFKLISQRRVDTVIHLDSNEDIQNLFAMTPYFYTTTAQGRERLAAVQTLDTEIDFEILVYNKI